MITTLNFSFIHYSIWLTINISYILIKHFIRSTFIRHNSFLFIAPKNNNKKVIYVNMYVCFLSTYIHKCNFFNKLFGCNV